MHTWQTHLVAVLRRLARNNARTSVAEIQQTLAGILDARAVRFLRPDETPFPADTTLADLLEQPYVARIDVAGELISPPAAAGDAPDTYAGSRFRPGEPAVPDSLDDPRFDDFFREFVRLESSHDFMWAGYVVRELIPRLGFPADSAKLVLDRLCAEGILSVNKVPNPRNPGFPASGVSLNHSHPRVVATLAPASSPAPASGDEPDGAAAD